MNQDAGLAGSRTNQQGFMIFIRVVRHLRTGFVESLRSEELAAWLPESGAPFSGLMK